MTQLEGVVLSLLVAFGSGLLASAWLGALFSEF